MDSSNYIPCNHKYVVYNKWRYRCLVCSKMVRSHFALESLLENGIYDQNITDIQKTGYLWNYLNF